MSESGDAKRLVVNVGFVPAHTPHNVARYESNDHVYYSMSRSENVRTVPMIPED